jgi:hypothetical protein
MSDPHPLNQLNPSPAVAKFVDMTDHLVPIQRRGFLDADGKTKLRVIDKVTESSGTLTKKRRLR